MQEHHTVRLFATCVPPCMQLGKLYLFANIPPHEGNSEAMDAVLAGAILSAAMAAITLLLAFRSIATRARAEAREREAAHRKNQEFFGLP